MAFDAGSQEPWERLSGSESEPSSFASQVNGLALLTSAPVSIPMKRNKSTATVLWVPKTHEGNEVGRFQGPAKKVRSSICWHRPRVEC